MGLVGLLCTKLGAASVLLSDYEPAVLAHLGSNVALNSLQPRCRTQQLDFRHPGAGLRPDQQRTWRLAVAADVLYCEAIVPHFIATLKLALHAQGGACCEELGEVLLLL